jgi:Transposase DDE domain
MESLPPEIARFILEFRSLFRVEVFDSFIYLLFGVILGEARYGTVRSAVFAPADYQPQRLSDLFCRHKLSHQAFMAQLAIAVLERVYKRSLPERLFWIADSTQSEKLYSERVASLGWFHRTKRVAGRTKKLKGHCYVFAAHLYRYTREKKARWGSVLVGALLYVKGRTIPQLVVELAKHLRLPEAIRHCWIVDRGIISRGLCRELAELGQFVLGRMRSNQVVYFTPEETETWGRPRLYGEKCRVDQLLERFPDQLRRQKMKLRVSGQTRTVDVYSAEVLLRGVWRGRAFPARIIMVIVPGLAIKPWYLLSTDLDLDPSDAVNAYDGRYQIEVNFDEVKELGLGHYQGRSAQGVRRWPLFLSAVQTILKLIVTGKLPADLPTLNWEWYKREDSVGQVRRRIIEHCRPPLSRTKVATASLK